MRVVCAFVLFGALHCWRFQLQSGGGLEADTDRGADSFEEPQVAVIPANFSVSGSPRVIPVSARVSSPTDSASEGVPLEKSAVELVDFGGLPLYRNTANYSASQAPAGSPCNPPQIGGLVPFLGQCRGHCARVAEPVPRQVAPGKWTSPTSVIIDFYKCSDSPLARTDLWSMESFELPPKRRFGLSDLSLQEAMSFSVQISELEVETDEQREAALHCERKEDFLAVYGVGTRRALNSHIEARAASMFAAHSVRGGKGPVNEDAMFWLDTAGIAAMAVFDGHQGEKVADFAAYRFLREVPFRWLQSLRGEQEESFWKKTLASTFAGVHMDVKAMKVRGGSTGSVIVSDKGSGMTTVAWLGDSRVVHLRKQEGRWIQLWTSTDHHCTHDQLWKNDEERKKKPGAANIECVERKGDKSRVKKGVQGIGVTRSLGDVHYHDEGMLLSTPEIAEFEVEPGDIIMVASDGVWDMLTDKDGGGCALCLQEIDKGNRQGDLTSAALSIVENAQARWHGTPGKPPPDDISIVIWRAQASQPAVDALLPYTLYQSSAQWLAGGELGDWCQQTLPPTTGLKEVARQAKEMWSAFNPFNNQIPSEQYSTCRRTKVVATQQLPGNSTLQSQVAIYEWKEIQLFCYTRGGQHGLQPAEGGLGVCAIGKRENCGFRRELGDRRKDGCRPGKRCRQDVWYDEYDAPTIGFSCHT